MVDRRGDGWKDWCTNEEFAGKWTHVYDVRLVPDANVLRIKNEAELDQFRREWGVLRVYGSLTEEIIPWEAVSTKYDGIIIAPYLWKRRHDPHWYYGWDCASGCIWKARAISRIELVERNRYKPWQCTRCGRFVQHRRVQCNKCIEKGTQELRRLTHELEHAVRHSKSQSKSSGT